MYINTYAQTTIHSDMVLSIFLNPRVLTLHAWRKKCSRAKIHRAWMKLKWYTLVRKHTECDTTLLRKLTRTILGLWMNSSKKKHSMMDEGEGGTALKLETFSFNCWQCETVVQFLRKAWQRKKKKKDKYCWPYVVGWNVTIYWVFEI